MQAAQTALARLASDLGVTFVVAVDYSRVFHNLSFPEDGRAVKEDETIPPVHKDWPIHDGPAEIQREFASGRHVDRVTARHQAPRPRPLSAS